MLCATIELNTKQLLPRSQNNPLGWGKGGDTHTGEGCRSGPVLRYGTSARIPRLSDCLLAPDRNVGGFAAAALVISAVTARQLGKCGRALRAGETCYTKIGNRLSLRLEGHLLLLVVGKETEAQEGVVTVLGSHMPGLGFRANTPVPRKLRTHMPSM